MKNFLKKLKLKLPRWLFVWLIKKGFMLPEPMQYGNSFLFSELAFIKIAPPILQDDFKRVIKEQMYATIDYVWLRYSYTPIISSILVVVYPPDQDNMIKVTWKYSAEFSLSRNEKYLKKLSEQIDSIFL